MDSIYHEGERNMQKEAGAMEAATKMGRTVLPVISHVYVDFIHSRPFLILGAPDSQGLAWCSLLSSRPGFMKVIDEQTLGIDVLPDDQDPLCGTLRDGSEVGILLIDFATRRRLRLNGSAVRGQGGFSVRIRQVYANCPRYIQSRTCQTSGTASVSPRSARQGTSLSREQRARIERADTFFVASYHPEGGADVSHRGGFPGFVQILDEVTLAWPDYNGNGMFNTLGNIIENPGCGLLFLDFETGGILQLSGSAAVIRDPIRAAPFPGAERIVEFRIERILETENATGLRWRFDEYSPDNPWFC
jgi:predicted pyridoxine 5'-phosphate oxidase superfamily flavin-nucleotide-binding protein